MVDFLPTTEYTVHRAKDGVLYWKCTWNGTDSAGGSAYWPNELRDMFIDHGVVIDKVVIQGTTGANETYHFVFYQNNTNKGAMYGPSGATVAATKFQDEHDGPYGPFIIDRTTSNLAFWLFAFDGAFTAGDDFVVSLAGRGLPPEASSTMPTTPVTVKKIEVWPWQRG